MAEEIGPGAGEDEDEETVTGEPVDGAVEQERVAQDHVDLEWVERTAKVRMWTTERLQELLKYVQPYVDGTLGELSPRHGNLYLQTVKEMNRLWGAHYKPVPQKVVVTQEEEDLEAQRQREEEERQAEEEAQRQLEQAKVVRDRVMRQLEELRERGSVGGSTSGGDCAEGGSEAS